MADAEALDSWHILVVLQLADPIHFGNDFTESTDTSKVVCGYVPVLHRMDWCGGLFDILDAGYYW